MMKIFLKPIGRALLGAVILTASLFHEANATENSVTHQIVIEKFKFVPAALTIKSGDSVEWINRDVVPHTATQGDRAWDTNKLNKAQTGKITFSSPGLENYICRFHPNMKGEITVTAK